MRLLLLAVGLTLALGTSLAAAFFVVGGRLALQGPHVLSHSWPAIYALVALFAVIVAAPFRLALREIDWRLIAVIVGAWFGEYLVLASGILADELNPAIAVSYWIAATGGPIQPLAACAGALVGGWLLQRSARRA